jgi:release factor glutamine methyltransferase
VTAAKLAPDIAGALRWARARVAAVDARILLRHVLQCSAARLATYPEELLDAADWAEFRALVDRREAGEPIAYLTGEREFYGRSFLVTPAVLIPRPETELLVELALAHFGDKPRARVLDLGTGSGALAVTLAHELPDADLTAVDRSREALWVAMANAARLRASVSFVLGDWFSTLGGDRYQLIVANPPYVAAADPHLQEGDVRFEPCTALASGPDGLDDLAAIAAAAPRHLEPGGWLLMEHGYDQALAVRGLLTDAGFSSIASWQDLAGIERASGGQWLGR